MIRDVFYYGKKPNAHPREKFAESLEHARQQATTEHFWIINEFCDYRGFDWDYDFDFLPDEEVWSQDHINIWPSQWQKDSGTWLCANNDSEIKIYLNTEPVKRKNEINQYWEIPDNIDISTFDFSWHPDPTSPPYIYQYGSIIGTDDGPKYVVPNNTGEIIFLERMDKKEIIFPKYLIKTSLQDLINEHPDEIFWAIRDNINYENFDFNWRPNLKNTWHINVFGSTESEITQTYFVNGKMIKNGYKQFNYIEDKKLDDEYLAELFKPMDMFFVDKGNIEVENRFNELQKRFPKIQRTRYLNSWVDTINRCIRKSETELCWILNSELDYTDFDFNYYPNPWQMRMVHVFGTQWNHWGTTFIVNKESFPEDTKYIKIIEHLPNLNFVKKTRATATSCNYDVYFINHGNDESVQILEQLKQRVKNVFDIKYNKDYLQTFKDLLKELPTKKEHYIWVCSSICNYESFDFTYICDPFSLEQLHVFPSDKQKYGDTFFVNVNKLRTLIDDLDKLESLEKINFNPSLKTKRLSCPTVVVHEDTHTNFMKYNHNFPYAVYVTEDNQNIAIRDEEIISLWSESSKNIIKTTTGGTRVIIPKEAENYVKKELYDYPYIITSSRTRQSYPMDIVFLSNGEKCADEHFEYLKSVTRGIPNRITRVDGVNGRVAAYHAAANASNTPWMFTVFAKLRVNHKFDWSWQPDRLQQSKHYIFYATNPVNGLEYGHQAMIAYNKKIVLSNIGRGLDFTLDDEHEVVPLNSGTAIFNTDEFSTWRTSFREAIKLRNDTSEESKQRLEVWLNVASGDFAEYSIKGAKDAVEYYEEVNGDLEKLKLSYEWAWLKQRFNK